MYRRLTLRRMPTHTRKLARLINDLESVTTRLKNYLPTVQQLELDSKALFAKKAYYQSLKEISYNNTDVLVQ